MPVLPSIAVTCGEPAGIGPELLAMLAQRHIEKRWPARLVFIGDRALLAERAARIGFAPLYVDYDAAAFAPSDAVEILDVAVTRVPAPGQPDPINAKSVLAMLERACDGCVAGE